MQHFDQEIETEPVQMQLKALESAKQLGVLGDSFASTEEKAARAFKGLSSYKVISLTL